MRLEPKAVTVNGQEYLIGRVDLFDLLNVERLVAPILPTIFHEALGKIAEAIIASKSEDEAQVEDRLMEIANLCTICKPILNDLAQMKREDFETVVRTCLSCVEKKLQKGYARIYKDGVLLFDDIDQLTVLVLVFHVLSRELRPTIAALLGQKSEQARQKNR